jgi:hypothetical protein
VEKLQITFPSFTACRLYLKGSRVLAVSLLQLTRQSSLLMYVVRLFLRVTVGAF